MEVYTITLQFRVEADDEADARGKADFCCVGGAILDVARVVTEPAIQVHHYETVPE